MAQENSENFTEATLDFGLTLLPLEGFLLTKR
jgi:hypothetical protein